MSLENGKIQLNGGYILMDILMNTDIKELLSPIFIYAMISFCVVSINFMYAFLNITGIIIYSSYKRVLRSKVIALIINIILIIIFTPQYINYLYKWANG